MHEIRSIHCFIGRRGCISAAMLYIIRIHDRTADAPALKVRAVAHQWWWEFDYPSLGVRTSDVLYLPSGRDVRLELRSGDVIHSFWIAGMKDSVDIIPGKTRLLDLVVKSPGELYGNCDSGCGCGTVCMRFRVMASAPLQFQRWAADARLRRSEFKPPQTADTRLAYRPRRSRRTQLSGQSFAAVARR
jgi:heme/copper-type cytochrome/quinol oxidase subunit 2